MALGDILAGFSEAAHEHNKTLLQMDYQRKSQLADQYARLAESPDYSEDQRAEFLNRALGIHQLPAGKKMPKEWENFTIQVTPKPIKIPGSGEGTGAAPIPAVGLQNPWARNTQTPGGVPFEPIEKVPIETPDELDARGSAMGLPAPTPPQPLGQTPDRWITPAPYTKNLLQPMSFEERMRRKAAESEASSAFMSAQLRAGQWKKVGQGISRDANGQRISWIAETRVNPATGEEESRTTPLAVVDEFKELSNGGMMPAARLRAEQQAYQAEGKPFQVLGPDSKEFDLDTLLRVDPDAVVQYKGNNRWVVATPQARTVSAGGNVFAFNPITQQPGVVLGPANSTLQRETDAERAVQQPDNTIRKETFRSTQRTLPLLPNWMPSGVEAPLPPGVAANVQAASIGQPVGAPTAPVQGKQAAPPTSTPAAGTGPVIGGRGLSPKEKQDTEARYESFGQALDRFVDVMETINDPAFNFNSFTKRVIAQSKIDAHSPLRIIIANVAPSTPQEQKFAAAMIALSEDVNLLRAVYNATGFRGPEAFAQLLAQRGNVLGDPEIGRAHV